MKQFSESSTNPEFAAQQGKAEQAALERLQKDAEAYVRAEIDQLQNKLSVKQALLAKLNLYVDSCRDPEVLTVLKSNRSILNKRIKVLEGVISRLKHDSESLVQSYVHRDYKARLEVARKIFERQVNRQKLMQVAELQHQETIEHANDDWRDVYDSDINRMPPSSKKKLDLSGLEGDNIEDDKVTKKEKK